MPCEPPACPPVTDLKLVGAPIDHASNRAAFVDWLMRQESRNDAARHERDVPKRNRRKGEPRMPRALGAPMTALGHPPRPRRARGARR